MAIDRDVDGDVSPGDRLQYQITIVNAGNAAATGVVFDDTPDLNSQLATPGLITTTQGVVTNGNVVGDTAVSVDVGTVPASGSVTIVFLVDIDNPLAAGVMQITNQGRVRSNELPVIVTTDPSQLGDSKTTVTIFERTPLLRAPKIATLLVDADGNGWPSPGDTLLYQLWITNTGYGAATGVTLTDTPDPNTTLVVGSVQVNQGTITSGNNPGDTSVAVTIGTVPGRGGRVFGSFLVTINNPLPLGVTQVSNQSQGFFSGTPVGVSDDPSTAALGDATVTQVTTEFVPTPSATPTDTPTNSPTPTNTPTATPTNSPTNTPTTTATRTNTPTPPRTPTVTATPMVTPTPTVTPTSTPHAPDITGGVTSNSETLTGSGSPTCPCGGLPGCGNVCFQDGPCSPLGPCDGMVHVFDCGPDRTCYTCDDFEIAVPVTKDGNGNFTFHLTEPLTPGELIYARDDCFDPAIGGIGNPPAFGPPVMASVALVPVLSRTIFVALIGMLAFVGLASLHFRRRHA